MSGKGLVLTPGVRSKLLTLRITTITAEVTAAGVLELAFAFRTDANHGRHDCAGDSSYSRRGGTGCLRSVGARIRSATQRNLRA